MRVAEMILKPVSESLERPGRASLAPTSWKFNELHQAPAFY